MIKNLEGEIWKDIPGYEGLYQVSNLGRVVSIKRQVCGKLGSIRTINDKILKATISNEGYRKVKLYIHNQPTQSFSVHRIVIESFIGKQEGLVVDHIDNNRLNNYLENLRYCTNIDNNTIFRKPSKHGHIGIECNMSTNRWRGKIKINKKAYRTSYSSSKENAIEDYKKLWLKLKGYEFNPLGSPETLSLYQLQSEAIS